MSVLESVPSSAVIAATVVGAATVYYLMKGTSSGGDNKPDIQSEIVSESKENETGIIRNKKAKKELIVNFEEFKASTLAELYTILSQKFANNEFIGTRTELPNNQRGNFVFKTYKEVRELVDNFASGLTNLGLKPQTNLGVYAPNCEEWKICELACYLSSYVLVSLYDTLGPKAAEYILDHAQLPVVLVYNQATFDKLITAVEGMKTKHLETIIYIQKVSEESIEKAKQLNIKSFSFSEILKNGKENPAKLTPPVPSDFCSIMYTSGTTGEPKGVTITHEMVIATTAGFRAQNPPLPNVTQESYLSYLPLAHIMERTSHFSLMLNGGKIGFFSHDIRLLLDDMTALKPTFVVGAPRRIYDRVISAIETSGGFKKWMFYTAYEAKKKALANGQDTPFWNRIVFNKLHDKIFGGQVRAIASGSAPLSPKVHEFLSCFCPVVVEGYGLTETTAGCAVSSLIFFSDSKIQKREDRRVNTCGPPLPSVEIKFVDVPEMNYTSKDKPPRGQIYIRGPGVTKGYYKNPKATADAFTEDGWFKTGDIGRLNEDGSISIIDRAKNIFKLQHGEYVAPEYLETVCCRSKFVAQACVYGDSFQSFLVAVVVPDPEVVNKYAQDHGIKKDFKSLCNDPTIQAAILQDLNAVGREAKLFGFEIVKKIHLEPEPWTQENGILTPTFKLKRAECVKKYLPVINAMYAEGDGSSAM